MTFLNVALLMGLAAVVVPPILHLLNRRKYDVVDWAAMQFLHLAPRTRRKIFLEQFWLMLLRVLLLVLVVLAFAAPQIPYRLGGSVDSTPSRDIVILIDGSASMGYKHEGRTAAENARNWAADFISQLAPGDRVAVVQVKAQPIPIVGSLMGQRDQARNALELLGPPRGSADWPRAIQFADALLQQTGRGFHQIVVLSDAQRGSWADEATLARWDWLRPSVDREGPRAARVYVVNLAATRPDQPPNWSLDPILCSRAVATAGREVTFRSAVRYTGSGTAPPLGAIRFFVDGQRMPEIKPSLAPATQGQIGISAKHKLGVGSHLVALELADDPFPDDNRQSFALEVLPAIPVLLVDGHPPQGEFLRDALAPSRDPAPAFRVRIVTPTELSLARLNEPVAGPGTLPRVLVLADVEQLSGEQREAVEGFLNAGGSVLVTLGSHCDAVAWNRSAFRGGQGFLPARIGAVIGDEAKPVPAAKPQLASFVHPAVASFREELPGGLQTAVFPKRWKVDPQAGINGTTGTTLASFQTGEPFLVERAFGKGRVILSTVPFDNSWGSNLIRLPDFVRLGHELMDYLAGARSAERNLQPGQPIVFRPPPDEPSGPVAIRLPDGTSTTLAISAWPLIWDQTAEPGGYRITTPSARTVDFAVRSDPREAVLTPCSEDDWQAVRQAFPGLETIATADQIPKRPEKPNAEPQELWWLFLALVLLLLLGEVLYTRRLTQRGEHNLPE